MRYPPPRVVERVAAVHGGAVIPQQELVDAPAVLVAQVRPLDVNRERVEQLG
jgi:hypothetical protein